MQLGFYFDQTRCTGCAACMLACRQWHYEENHEWVDRRWVLSWEEGVYPDVALFHLTLSCLHCAAPLCARICAAKAIYKRHEDGIVVVESKKCIGIDCGLCERNCPYHAIKLLPDAARKVEKCDFCLERLLAGQQPICVVACPTRALDHGPLEKLAAIYGRRTRVNGFKYYRRLGPSILFRGE